MDDRFLVFASITLDESLLALTEFAQVSMSSIESMNLLRDIRWMIFKDPAAGTSVSLAIRDSLGHNNEGVRKACKSCIDILLARIRQEPVPRTYLSELFSPLPSTLTVLLMSKAPKAAQVNQSPGRFLVFSTLKPEQTLKALTDYIVRNKSSQESIDVLRDIRLRLINGPGPGTSITLAVQDALTQDNESMRNASQSCIGILGAVIKQQPELLPNTDERFSLLPNVLPDLLRSEIADAAKIENAFDKKSMASPKVGQHLIVIKDNSGERAKEIYHLVRKTATSCMVAVSKSGSDFYYLFLALDDFDRNGTLGAYELAGYYSDCDILNCYTSSGYTLCLPNDICPYKTILDAACELITTAPG